MPRRPLSRMTSSLAALVLCALGLTTLGLQAAGPVAAAPTPHAQAASRPHQDGRWLLDANGRVLVLHGVNMVSKVGDYAPDQTGFGADDAAFLASNGFTTVRLGLIWKAVEPRPGEYDDRYLARIRATTELLAKHGIWTMLDFHQDLYHERFQGEGAPDWAVQDDGLPAQPTAGFPGNYLVMPALNRAFDHFWANDLAADGVGIQEHYARAWRHVAQYFRGTEGVMGIDLFNEPWPGSAYPTCVNPVGCPAQDAELTSFSERALARIRSVDPSTVVFYEPNVLFNSGVDTWVAPEGEQLGFSFHDYCLAVTGGLEDTGLNQLPCAVEDGVVWDNMNAHVAARAVTPLLTEFGAIDDENVLTTMVDRAAANRTGWQYWAYCGCDDPTTTGPGDVQALVFDPSKAPSGDNVDQMKLRALAVPHPLTVAGTPVAYGFERSGRVFSLRYTTARAGRAPGRFGAGARTVLSVPVVQYPQGFVVRVRGARVLSQAGGRVVLAQSSNATRTVTVSIRPR